MQWILNILMKIAIFQLRRELGRLLCDPNAKTVAPKHRKRKLSSKKLFKYTNNNESTANSGSSSQHDDGRCEASTTQGGHDLLATGSSDINNGVSTNVGLALGASVAGTITTTTVTAAGATVITTATPAITTATIKTTAIERPHRRLLVDNGVVIIAKNDACDV